MTACSFSAVRRFSMVVYMEKKKRNHKRGRPSVMTDDVISKVEYAYSIGATDMESALYADISTVTLYKYLKDNPDFANRRNELKRNPILKAKQAVFDSVADGDTVTAKWLLEHKASDEYNTRSEVAVTADGVLSIEERSEALSDFLKQFNGE